MTLSKQIASSLALMASLLVTTAHAYDKPTVFSGSGKDGATQAANAFRDHIGADKTNRIAWDAVKLDGTDANPNTRIIDFGKTVEIPIDRFRAVGAIFGDPYAVSGDGFASVNPYSAGQFPAFSPNNTFVMFDTKPWHFEDRIIEQTFVIPATADKAGSRGFGAIFIDVEKPQTSYIEYFGKDKEGNQLSLGKYEVPTGKSGEPEFLGVVFPDAVIEEVKLTVGTNALFSFDGYSIASFGKEKLDKCVDLAVTDDFLFAKPEPLQYLHPKAPHDDSGNDWDHGDGHDDHAKAPDGKDHGHDHAWDGKGHEKPH